MSEAPNDAGMSDRRVVKRYSNRKLYDTKDSRYVTLLQIAEMIRAGEDVQIIDNASKEDKTDVTLALIISEELKNRPHAIPIATLKRLIRNRGERMLSQIKDGPLGRLTRLEAGQEGDDAMSPGKGLFATLDAWQQAIDERIRTVLPHATGFRELQEQIREMNDRLAKIEAQLANDSSKPEE